MSSSGARILFIILFLEPTQLSRLVRLHRTHNSVLITNPMLVALPAVTLSVGYGIIVLMGGTALGGHVRNRSQAD